MVMTEKATTTSNILGTIGTVLWCIQLIPQIIHNYRRKNCEGLPSYMMLLWAMSGVPFAIYFIVQQANVPVQVQPHVFLVLSLICWYQCMIYPPIQYNKKKAIFMFVAILVVFAGIEAGCVFPFKSLYKRHITWPTTLFGVIAAVLLAVGLLPPYWELYKRQGRVVGLNFIFLAIDSSGAIFSLLSLVTQNGDLDLLGVILYAIIVVLEGGLYVSQLIWLIRTRGGKKPLKKRRDSEDTLSITTTGKNDDDEENQIESSNLTAVNTSARTLEANEESQGIKNGDINIDDKTFGDAEEETEPLSITDDSADAPQLLLPVQAKLDTPEEVHPETPSSK